VYVLYLKLFASDAGDVTKDVSMDAPSVDVSVPQPTVPETPAVGLDVPAVDASASFDSTTPAVGTPAIDAPAVEGSVPKGEVTAALPDAPTSAPTGEDAEVETGGKKKKSRFGLPSFFSSSSKKKTADAESSSSSDAEQSQALPEVPAAPAADVDAAAGDVPAVEGSVPKGEVSAALPDASAPAVKDTEGAGTTEPLEGEEKKKKKSRFGLPSFLTPGSKKTGTNCECHFTAVLVTQSVRLSVGWL
jgi:hypothetical protein